MRKLTLFTLVAGLLFLLAGAAEAATRYAAPTSPALLLGGAVGSNVTGSGTACTVYTTPCTLATAMSQAVAGDTIILKKGNGTISNPLLYRGTNDMLAPSAGKAGTGSGNIFAPIGTPSPITVLAEEDGTVLIDGEFVRGPVRLVSNNKWWTIEGINFRSSNLSVINITGRSENIIMRRIVAWDATISDNASVANISNTNFVLFEDAAFFGTGRKVVSPSAGGNDFTCRRCWIRWEGTISGGLGANTFYKSYNNHYENTLVTVNGISLPENWTDNNGVARDRSDRNFTSAFGGLVGERERDTISSPTNNTCSGMTVRASISYESLNSIVQRQRSGGTWTDYALFSFAESNCVTVSDLIGAWNPADADFNRSDAIVLQRTVNSSASTIANGRTCGALVSQTNSSLCNSTLGGTAGAPCYNSDPNAACTQVSANNLTSIVGTQGNNIHADYTGSNRQIYASKEAMQAAGASPWQTTSGTGARMCYRTVNGVLSSNPLWPWPMNERIKKATGYAGSAIGSFCGAVSSYPLQGNCVGGRDTRTEVDVTAEIEALLGAIPAQCRTGGVVTPVLTRTPASLTFNATAGLGNPSAQAVQIIDTANAGTMSWTVSDNASWLSSTPVSGVDDGSIAVSVDNTGLTAGVYNGTITIAATGATGTPQTVAVTLNLDAPPIIPALVVTAGSMEFLTAPNISPSARQLIITDSMASGSMSWTISDTASWLSVSPSSGSNNGTSLVTVDVSGLTPNIYQANITVTAAGATGSPVVIPVTLTVLPAATPGHRHGGRLR